METDEIYQLIKGRHKELADGFRAMARGAETLASLLDVFGQQTTVAAEPPQPEHVRTGNLETDYVASRGTGASIWNAPGAREYIDGLRGDAEPSSETEPCPPPEMAPREQWPDIGRTTSLEFVDTPDGFIMRGTVDVECHPKTSEVAEADFLALHPFAPGVRTKFAEWPSVKPPEMAVHTPSTVPPTVDPIELESTHVDATAPEQSAPVKPARAKNKYTAKQWAESSHFLAYVKKNEPFKSWTAEQQNAKRDAFVAKQNPDARMNRWGERFAKFCTEAS